MFYNILNIKNLKIFSARPTRPAPTWAAYRRHQPLNSARRHRVARRQSRAITTRALIAPRRRNASTRRTWPCCDGCRMCARRQRFKWVAMLWCDLLPFVSSSNNGQNQSDPRLVRPKGKVFPLTGSTLIGRPIKTAHYSNICSDSQYMDGWLVK